jgi:hypothetical protein
VRTGMSGLGDDGSGILSGRGVGIGFVSLRIG